MSWLIIQWLNGLIMAMAIQTHQPNNKNAFKPQKNESERYFRQRTKTLKQSKMESLFDDLKTDKIAWHGNCRDCEGNTTVTASRTPEGIKITGGAIYEVEIDGDNELFFKCDGCFLKDKTLRNFRPTEVYCRTVGYYRPVKNMSGAKQSEFKMRKNFKVEENTH